MREIGELQERAARAVPAAVEENKDGCCLRYSDCASTWWAGATLLHGNARSRPLARRIAAAEAFYAAHGVPARFQLCPACPSGLDAALAHRGYGLDSVISRQVATTSTIADGVTARSLHVDLNDQLNQQWVELLMAAQGPDLDPAPEWRLLRRVDGGVRTPRLPCSIIWLQWAQPSSTPVGSAYSTWRLSRPRAEKVQQVRYLSRAEWAISQGLQHMYLQRTGPTLRLSTSTSGPVSRSCALTITAPPRHARSLSPHVPATPVE